MSRQINKLTALSIQRINQPGYHGDGGGLWLQVSPSGSRSWIFRYGFQGRRHELGLGPVRLVSLSDARQKAQELRLDIFAGKNPIVERRALSEKVREQGPRVTFAECATRYIEIHRPSWSNEKHVAQWESTLKTYAFPVIGKLPVEEVATSHIERILRPIWVGKTETAKRLRGRLQSVLDWAKVQGFRSGENPARWSGHLDHILPKPSRVAKVEHHAALAWQEMPAFMSRLRLEPGLAARALELTILTAVRTGEALGARREEFDLAKRIWTIPAHRMKMNRTHRIPLSEEALAIVRDLPPLDEILFFPGNKPAKPLSDMAMAMVLRRMKVKTTVHGFRSSFRDWASDATNFPDKICEHALAHQLGSATQRAYDRTDLFQKRKELMQAWADFLSVF